MTMPFVKMIAAFLLILTGLWMVFDLREFLSEFKPTAFSFSYLIGRLIVAGLFAGTGALVLWHALRSKPPRELSNDT